jgi:hypothetical protein
VVYITIIVWRRRQLSDDPYFLRTTGFVIPFRNRSLGIFSTVSQTFGQASEFAQGHDQSQLRFLTLRGFIKGQRLPNVIELPVDRFSMA